MLCKRGVAYGRAIVGGLQETKEDGHSTFHC